MQFLTFHILRSSDFRSPGSSVMIHHFPEFRTGFVVNWSQKWISSGFAHISSGPDKLENLGRYISWIRFIYTVIYSIVKKSCSHFHWLAPNSWKNKWLNTRVVEKQKECIWVWVQHFAGTRWLCLQKRKFYCLAWTTLTTHISGELCFQAWGWLLKIIKFKLNEINDII